MNGSGGSMFRFPSIPWNTLVFGAAALLTAASPTLFNVLVYSRDSILRGQLWRTLTCHLVHAGSYHLTLDLAAFLVLGGRFEKILGWKRFLAILAGSALAVSFGLIFLQPDLEFYCGLSGVLNGVWVAGSLAAARMEGSNGNNGLSLFYLGLVLAGFLKIGLEAIGGFSLFTDPSKLGAEPVPLAHALGALGGIPAALLRGKIRSRKHDACSGPDGEIDMRRRSVPAADRYGRNPAACGQG